MRTSILFLACVLFVNCVIAQKENPANYLEHLPKNLEIDKSISRSYQMTTDYYDYNLKSEFLRKQRIAGIISYVGDSARWNDVHYSISMKEDADYPEGKKLEFLQDFTYLPDEEVLTAGFFNNNLPEADPSVMNLIWDAFALDAFAYRHWDALKLNKEFDATEMNSEIKIADIGTFENKDIRITWIGITKMNNKLCAIIKYSVMNNPVKVEYDDVSMSGRSHYWGEIYVSLEDKHIEYASLMEDVLTDVKIKNQPNNFLGYTIRTITLSKIN